MNPQSLATHRDDWEKIVKVWYRSVDYAKDPKTEADALKIMAARDNLTPDTLEPLWKGTHVLTLAEARVVMEKQPGLASLYGSTRNADAFNMSEGIYKDPQSVDSYIEPAFVTAPTQ